MSTLNKCFYGELTKIILKLSSNILILFDCKKWQNLVIFVSVFLKFHNFLQKITNFLINIAKFKKNMQMMTTLAWQR